MADEQAGMPAAAGGKKQNETLVKLRPTLFIAVGGTGMEVLMRVRRRILNASWGRDRVRVEALSAFPVAEFIQFDLDQGAVVETGKSQKEDLQHDLLRFTDDEKLIENFDIEKYSRDDDTLARYPHVQSWLPLTPAKIRELRIDPAKGAGQIRALSRLYFFDKYAKIRDKIRLKLKALKSGLTRDRELKQLGLELDQSKVRVVVVGSVAGGTGSGSFLDMGWLSRWLAETEFSGAEVELMLFMPGGFARANKDRTEANGYAALMELETAMLGDTGYVERWDAYDRPQLKSRPYSEVYLIDSGNLARQNTSDMNDVYHMVADALFEDFASADFANRKRSIAVNQQQHKILPFSPPLPANRFGDMKLSYARSFSAFGQAVLDTQLAARGEERAHALAAAMLKAFFGVAGSDTGTHRATEKQRDDFMAANLHLRAVTFSDFPEFSSRHVALQRSHGDFRDYAVVEDLLSDRQGALIAGVQQRVSAQLEDIRNGFARDEWATQIRDRVRQLERDVMRDQDSQADTTEDRISRRRRELTAEIREVVRRQLFAYLDNRDFGGLEYVLSLVEQIKDRLENAATGVCAELDENAARYAEIKDAVRTHEYERLMQNLAETRGGVLGGLFGGGERQAETVLGQLATEIANGLKFHLREKAAREAAGLMRDVSRWLGERQGVDAEGRAIWSGLVGELQAGREAVRDMLALLERHADILRADLRGEHATLIPLATTDVPFELPAPATLREWADEAFKDIGGSSVLFPMLTDPDRRPELLRKVVRMAERQIEIGGADSAKDGEPLIRALEELSPNERQRLFGELLSRAMPWIDANLSRDFTPAGDQYKCFIGVARADEFRRKFEAELMDALPGGLGITAAQIGIVETGISGRAVCYTELSGIPLTILRGLEAWRTSYRKESERIPVHTHLDVTRFTHPLSPSVEELNHLAEDFRYYLLAVMLGVLERVRTTTVPAGQYQFAVARGDVRRIGNERAVRQNGLPPTFRDLIVDRVNQTLDALGVDECLALATLAEYYATDVYTPTVQRLDSGAEDIRIGLACTEARDAKRMVEDRASRKGATAAEIAAAPTRLAADAAALREWAMPIAESDADGYRWEVRPPESESSPRLKFAMRRDAAADAAIARLLGKAAAPAAFAAPGPGAVAPLPPGVPPLPGAVPPPLAEPPYHVAVNGQTYGPYPAEQVRAMLAARQLDAASTKVWCQGMPKWVMLHEVPALMPAAPAVPPPLD